MAIFLGQLTLKRFFFQKMGKHNIAPFGDSVQIFASFPHTHTIGKAIKTVLVRNGSAIEELIRDDNYDFDFQVIIK